MRKGSMSALHSLIYAWLILFFALSGLAAASSDEASSVGKAIEQTMTQAGVKKNDSGVLVLTNAYYGSLSGHGADKYRDMLYEMTGRSCGKHNLLDVHTAFTEPLWFSIFRKDSNKLIFCKWKDGSFKTQTLDLSPDALLTPDAWKQASSGIIGKGNLYQVVSISLAWSAGAAWPMLKAAGFHDHICPGINIGYAISGLLTKSFQLDKGERYIFFGALPKCYMDTLQILYDTTLGKQQAYGVTMSDQTLARYEENGAVPSVIVLKVNKRKNTCKGMVIGFSWKRILNDLGLRMADFAPKGGMSNPVFFITRVKASWKMAQMKPEDKMKWLIPMKTFSGEAKLAQKVCNAGGDPYAVVWSK